MAFLRGEEEQWSDHTSHEAGHLHAFNPLTGGNRSAASCARIRRRTCSGIQLWHGSPTLISPIQRSSYRASQWVGLITDCTLFLSHASFYIFITLCTFILLFFLFSLCHFWRQKLRTRENSVIWNELSARPIQREIKFRQNLKWLNNKIFWIKPIWKTIFVKLQNEIFNILSVFCNFFFFRQRIIFHVIFISKNKSILLGLKHLINYLCIIIISIKYHSSVEISHILNLIIKHLLVLVNGVLL